MLINCPECGNKLTQEMIEANMCWECGKILDESLLNDICDNDFEKCYDINKNIDNHRLTTTIAFEDAIIKKYIGLVSGETVMGTGFLADVKASFSDLFGKRSEAYSEKMKRAKQIAISDMVKESISKGGNAIIGVSFSYVTFAGSNMIGISVNGTSVLLENT